MFGREMFNLMAQYPRFPWTLNSEGSSAKPQPITLIQLPGRVLKITNSSDVWLIIKCWPLVRDKKCGRYRLGSCKYFLTKKNVWW